MFVISFTQIDPRTIVSEARGDSADVGTLTGYRRSPLDRTRIHPESYPLAGKMAVDALEYDEQEHEDNTYDAIEEILQSPERLRDLDLDAFAEELKRNGHGDKHITLYDIRKELTLRYKDYRVPFRPMDPDERFYIITKETMQTFFVGKLVQARIIQVVRRPPRKEQLDNANPVRNEQTMMWICPFCQQDDFPELSNMWSHFDGEACPGEPIGLRCLLDNGVIGFLHTRLLSDNKVENIFERVEIGMIVDARITRIDMEKFRVDLTTKSSDLKDDVRLTEGLT